MTTRLRMRYPSRTADGIWKEALPIGNGLTGALMPGSAGEEYIFVNRFDRWQGGDENDVIPDVSDALHKMRSLQKEGKFLEANGLLSAALSEKGYPGRVGGPVGPAVIRMDFDSDFPFRDYERGIDLTKGEAYVSFTQDGKKQERKAFVSRVTDALYIDVSADYPLRTRIIEPDTGSLSVRITAYDGKCSDGNGFRSITDCTHFTLICSFGTLPGESDYSKALDAHIPLHRKAMGDALLDMGGHDTPSDILLDEVYTGEDSPEVYEKFWAMGRYLFACGTAEGGYPFPLYGLWHGTDNPMWAQNVANENVEMIYWHTLTGGYADLIRPLIHYYFSMMDTCRDAAKKLFGARGIFVSVYSTPVSCKPEPNVPVITNYTGAAGWLSRIFYDYYRYTGDRELLEKEILPFMTEAALFYEDYAQTDENGRILLSPSVSPENTPKNLMPEITGQRVMGHPCPAVDNATMEIAIMKELLTHLLELNESIPLDPERVENWRRILKTIPEYMVNSDGAVKEWMDERLEDNYRHRHLSHIYPLFPGDEIGSGHPLFKAFEKAVDLRKLGSQSGWSLAHMAAIYCRLGRGNRALECLNTMARSCLLGNFFTQHNDWRNMGLTLTMGGSAPVQLDALMGAVNAIQEMLLRADRDSVRILPACPELLNKGSFSNWHIPGGVIDAEWDIRSGSVSVRVTAVRDISFSIVFPDFAKNKDRLIELKAGETEVI